MSSISRATLGRLPVYLEYLKSLDSETVSSASVSRAPGIGEVHVRKDLGSVSGDGRPRIGYVTSELICAIERCLGASGKSRAVIVGAGKMGRAMLDYEGFSEYGIEISAAIDIDESLLSASQTVKPIIFMESFKDFLSTNAINIGIITVPKESAQEICDLMVANGIKAIRCFALTKLSVQKRVNVRYENLALSFAHL